MNRIAYYLTLYLMIWPCAAYGDDVQNSENSSNETDKAGDVAADTVDGETGDSLSESEVMTEPLVHVKKKSPYRDKQTIDIRLVTSAGEISCRLLAGDHPYTVMNFVALASGKPEWTDSAGEKHAEPYYRELKFGTRSKDAFVVSGNAGVDFVIPDERCSEHGMTAGAMAMVQAYPGQASSQFILAARDLSEFKGMFTVFGQCDSLETIKALTRDAAVLERVELVK